MDKGLETEKSKEPTTIFEDSIFAGTLLAKGHKVIPVRNPDGKIVYSIEGDVEKSVQEIFANCPLGALDVLRAIKLTRSMIFNLRSGGLK